MEEGRNIRLDLAYDGGRYHGWQRQKKAITIQALLEDKLQTILDEAIILTAAGRTDAGVHALNQTCNFRTDSKLNPGTIRRALNALLPDDILINRAFYVTQNFHARYGAKAKTYEYRLLNRPEPDIFLRYYTWHIPQELDLAAMEACLPILRGLHDFSSFKSTGSGIKNPVRDMLRAELVRGVEGRVTLVFQADGFLRHMVRNIVGTLVQVGRGRLDPGGFGRILDAKDRQAAGKKSPPQGLFLKGVQY